NLPTVGGPIVRELARLKDGGDLTSARALIEAAEQMRPGLQSKYADDLQRLKRDVQQALAEKGQTLREDNAAGPRPVPDPAPVALAPGVALA
ncbi:MAG TPA: hypothetical protein VK324_11100, partial [Tepidisphaeraceae bacterium]|nr:hypothetical protein [Tepidisphaeraceae bacterium]